MQRWAFQPGPFEGVCRSGNCPASVNVGRSWSMSRTARPQPPDPFHCQLQSFPWPLLGACAFAAQSVGRNAQDGCIRVVHHYAPSCTRPVAHCAHHRQDARPHGFGKLGPSRHNHRQIVVVGATGGGMTGGCFAKCLCLCDLRVFPSGFVNRRSTVRIRPVAVHGSACRESDRCQRSVKSVLPHFW